MSNGIAALPRANEGMQQKSALIFIFFVVCAFAYAIVKDSFMSRLFFVATVFGGGMIFLINGLFNRKVLTYFLVAYIPFSKQMHVGFGNIIPGLNLTNILVVLLAFLWISERNKKEGPLLASTPLNTPIFVFVSLGILSIILNIGYGFGYLTEAALEYYTRWIVPFFLYFYFVNVIRDKETIKNIVTIIVLVTTMAALMAIYEYLETDKRVGGIVDQPNFLAAFFNYYMFIPFAFFVVHMKRFSYWLLLIPFLIQLRGIMVTFSRASYLAFAVSLYALACFKSRLFLFLMIAGTVLVILNPAFLPEGIRYRMAQTFQKHHANAEVTEVNTGSLDDSASERLKVWEGATAMIKEHPLLGVGFHLFEVKVLHYWAGSKSHDTHNTYLSIASEMGIPALIVFFWILWRFFCAAWRFYKKTQDPFSKSLTLGILSGLFGLLISNMYGCRFNYPEISIYFWILAASIVKLEMLEGASAHE